MTSYSVSPPAARPQEPVEVPETPEPTQAPLSCTFEGQTYTDGEEWQPEVCLRCICDRGIVNCESVSGCGEAQPAPTLEPGTVDCRFVICPEVECVTQTYIPLGQCCPVCAGKIDQCMVKKGGYSLLILVIM
jgi:hypothetical protein